MIRMLNILRSSLMCNIYKFCCLLCRWSSSWWTREKLGEYFPIFTRDHPPLLDYLSSMKVLSSSAKEDEPIAWLKMILDLIRSSVIYVEPSILLISLFITGCVLILTVLNRPKHAASTNKSVPLKKKGRAQ